MKEEEAKKLSEIVQTKDVQNILIAVITDAAFSVISSPALSRQARSLVLAKILQKLIEEELLIGDEEDLLSASEMSDDSSEEVSIPQAKKKTDEDIEQFHNIMKDVVEKNKGKKSIRVTKDVENLVDIIDDYKGSSSVMNNVKKMMSSKSDRQDKIKVVKKFIESVI